MFYRKHIFLTLLLIFICGIGLQGTSAQQVDKFNLGQVSGRVFDKLTNKPLQFASFVVTSIKDSSRIYGSETDSSGKFLINNIPLGIYRAKVSLIGYQTRTRKNIILSPIKNELRIDTLLLMPLGITKEEVQIIAQKERIVYDKDNKNKISINPDKDWGVNAFELLDNTPMVHIDFDEKNISLMGKGGTKIFVNGQPGEFYGIESLEDLKLMSADEIESFELIINPAEENMRYNQSGDNSGGIINIVPKKKITTSYTGSAGLDGNSDNRYRGNLDGRYNSPGVTAGLSYLTSNSEHKSDNSMVRQLTFGDTSEILNQSSENDNRNLTNRYSLRLSLMSINDYNIFTNVSFNEGYNLTGRNIDNSYLGNNYYNNTSSKNLLKLFNTNFTYTKTLPGIKQSLSVNIFYSNNRMNIENYYDRRNLLSYQTLTDTTLFGNDKSANTNNNINWNLIYIKGLSQYLTFSTGYRGNHLEMLMNSDYLLFNPLNNTYVSLDNNKIRQKYYNNTHSIPLGISGSFGSAHYSAGLNTNIKISSTENIISNYSYNNKFISFDPGFNLDIQLMDIIASMISYRSSTSFPNNNQLNPYIDYSDSANLKSGNPFLRPTVLKQFQLDMIFFLASDFTMDISGNYMHYKDQINSVIAPVSPLITMTTYANVASSDILSLNIFLRKEFFKCLELSPSFSANKSKYSGTGIQNTGQDWSWSSIFNFNLKLGNFRFEADINYSSSALSVQQKTKPVWYVDAAAKLLLLHKALTLTFRATDLFNTRNSNSDNIGTGFIITNNIKQTTRIFSLSLSYFFRLEAQEIIEPDKPNDVLPDEF
jgi:hypothetical protein